MTFLENRPITQKALAGSGAFAFVFFAAMLGTAFMLSGGFGFGGDRSDPRRPEIVYQGWGDAWHEFQQPTPVRVQPAAARVEEPLPVEMSVQEDFAEQATTSDDFAPLEDAISDDDEVEPKPAADGALNNGD